MPRTLSAGFAATDMMTGMMYAAPLMDMPEMDPGKMLGGLLPGGPVKRFGPRWWAGLADHYVNGAVLFPLLYTRLVGPRLTGPSWLRGMQWGAGLWFLSQTLAMPVVGKGFFSSRTPQPVKAVAGNLLGHLVYGAVLGRMTQEEGI